MNILFVCTGNTCRSPIAEAMAIHYFREHPEFGPVSVGSAGIYAHGGDEASVGAISVARAHGMDLMSHRSSILTAAHLDYADRVFTMTAEQAQLIREQYPDYADKVEPFSETNINDPFGNNLASYVKTWDDIEAALLARFPHQKEDEQ